MTFIHAIKNVCYLAMFREYQFGRRCGIMAEHKFDTKSVHLGYKPAASNNYAIMPPIGLSVPYEQDTPATHRGFEYSRDNNPTRAQLEKALALLEDAKHGICYSSGTSAISAIVQLLGNGDHIVSSSIIYGGTYKYFETIINRANVTTTYVDATDATNVEKALRDNTKLVFLESASNPLNTVCDIVKIAEIVRRRKDIILAVDNTYLTPFLLKPLELGAHVAVYSVTKYLNGHDDVCMGAICCNDDELGMKLRYMQINAGLIPSPFECYLVFRSLMTLPLRMRKHMKNSLAVAKFLEAHPKVAKVIHPSLPSHPMYEVFKQQSAGHSGMVAFYVKGGLEEASNLLKSFKLITMCGSLGGVGTIAEVPSVLSHSPVPEHVRKQIGITDNLIRLSVGVEDAEDIIRDLDKALNAAVN